VRRVTFDLGTGSIELEVDGTTSFGDGLVLLDVDDDLTAGTPWQADGYTVAELLTADEFAELTLRFEDLLARVVTEAGSSAPGYAMQAHHRFVDDAQHAAVASAIRNGFPTTELGGLASRLTEAVSQLCGTDVVPVCPAPYEPGIRADGASRFFLRVVRPGSTTDHNPPHRDVWIPRLRNALNLYLPLCGSSPQTSLPLVPGSHRWAEAGDRAHGRRRPPRRRRLLRPDRGVVAAAAPLRAPRSGTGVGDGVLALPDPRWCAERQPGHHTGVAGDALLASVGGKLTADQCTAHTAVPWQAHRFAPAIA
jgi:hypothetical protein